MFTNISYYLWDNYWRNYRINSEVAIQVALQQFPGQVMKLELDYDNGILVFQNCLYDFVISIHSPRVGRDAAHHRHKMTPDNFNPLSPCGERLWADCGYDTAIRFQSTLPVWGETTDTGNFYYAKIISIHSPRVGRDSRVKRGRHLQCDFNPLSPCGERRSNSNVQS